MLSRSRYSHYTGCFQSLFISANAEGEVEAEVDVADTFPARREKGKDGGDVRLTVLRVVSKSTNFEVLPWGLA